LVLGQRPWLGCELGREAGFGEARQVFADPTDFFHMFRFKA